MGVATLSVPHHSRFNRGPNYRVYCVVQVLSVRDAQSLLKDEEDLVIAVYDYWLAKRLRLGRALIPAVKHERRDGTSSNNPYLAFRKRTEKMQTRKVSRSHCARLTHTMYTLSLSLSLCVCVCDVFLGLCRIARMTRRRTCRC